MHDRKSNRVENRHYFSVVKRLHSPVSLGINAEHIKGLVVSYYLQTRAHTKTRRHLLIMLKSFTSVAFILAIITVSAGLVVEVPPSQPFLC